MTYLDTQKEVAIRSALSRFEKVRVMLHSNDNLFFGQLYYSDKVRFLDTLNRGLDFKTTPIKSYLIMDEVIMVHHDNEKEQIEGTCFFAKDSVDFIGTFDETKSTSSEIIDTVRLYPWRKKEASSSAMCPTRADRSVPLR